MSTALKTEPRRGVLASAGVLLVAFAGGLGACGPDGVGDRAAIDDGAGASELRRRLVAALGPVRVGEGRLAGVEWAPVGRVGSAAAAPGARARFRGGNDGGAGEPVAVAAPVEPVDPRLRPVLSELRGVLADGRSPRDLAALGVWHLAAGRAGDAVAALEEARAAAPADPVLAGDLAAAHLARSAEPGREGDALLALEAAAAAAALAPESAEARFNLAVSLERLGLVHRARREWRRYLALDPSSDWAQEAAGRLRRLDAPDVSERWRRALPELSAAAAAGDGEGVAAAVEIAPEAARRRIEHELLAAWAEATADDRPREAAAALAEARAIGTALAGLGGDPLPAAAAGAIDRALAESPSRVDALVDGHLAFRDGLRFDADYAEEEAAGAFARAERSLAAGGSPFAGWAGLYGAIQEYRRERFAAALARLDAVAAAAEAAASPALAGRAEWIRGLALADGGRDWAALAVYRRARERFAEVREPGHCAVLDGLIAHSLRVIGDDDAARRRFALALAGLGRFPTVRSEQAILDAVSDALAAGGAGNAALHLQDEVADRLGDDADPTDLAYVDLKRSRLLRGLGRPQAALTALAAAEARSPRIAGPSVRELVETEIAVSRAELTAASDPSAAEAALGTAIASHTLNGRPFPLIQLHFARARLRLAAGDPTGVESDLRASIAFLERQREEIGAAIPRENAFARSEEIFAELVGLLARQPGRGEEAWAEAERARARVLLDLALRSPRPAARAAVPAAPPARSAPGADELRRRLPSGVAMVEYAVLPTETVAWVVRRDRVEISILRAGEDELRRRSEALVAAVREGRGEDPIRSAAGALADAVLAPLAKALRAGEPLVFVPDGPLIAVPFALLPDPLSGRLLIEERTVAVAPSAALFAQAAARSTPSAAGGGTASRVIVVGDPAFDEPSFPTLARLPGAAREARSVAQLYPAARLLLDDEATRRALLYLLPSAATLHLAAHAIPARGDPLSTALVLAGAGGEGTVAAREILALDLRSTRLVVLTACRAAAGVEDESNWTLAHAFLAAGVPTVVANLWEVDDRAGERLAVAFHRHSAAGAAPAEAMRAAQLEMLASPDPRDRDPAAWAGFRVIGRGEDPQGPLWSAPGH